jgi:anthranilate synthase/aminodeoxychorismate synthase-like glutamine amidotransferase
LGGECPLLGVCLGHQAIGQVYGGLVVRGEAPVHGKTSLIHHDGRTLFAGLPLPFVATRYHSLVLDPHLSPVLERSAWTEEGVVMAVRHREFAVEGVQFHPESLMTLVGKDLVRNFLSRRAARWEDPISAATTL